MEHLQAQTGIEVDGKKYLVQLYPPTYGFTLYARLLRLLGAPAINLIEGFKGADLSDLKSKGLDEILKAVDWSSAGDALQSLFANLPDDQVVPLLKDILAHTFHVGEPFNNMPVVDHFEVSFQGRYLHVFKLAGKTLGVQYQDFWSGLVKRAKGGKLAQASGSKKTA